MTDARDDHGTDGTLPRNAGSRRDRADGRDSEQNIDDEEVRRRAYDRFLARGDRSGDEVSDWLDAEREVRGERSADIQ